MSERPRMPQRILSIGYTTYDQAAAKGIIWDDPDSVLPWYNPGAIFPHATVFIPFGKADVDRQILPSVRYIEWDFRPRLPKMVAGVFRIFSAAAFAIRFQRENQIDVVRLNGPHFPALIGIFLRLFCRVPLLLFIEGFWEQLMEHNFPRPLRIVLPYWYKLTYRLFDAYCGTPSINPDYYVSRGMDRARISPWTHELDLETLERAASKETVPAAITSAGHPRLVAVGRLHAEKHAIDLVSVLSTVRRTAPNASLILVGDGDERKAIESEAAKLCVPVVITGNVTQAKALAIVHQCNIYTAPMQGNALVEAMAAGKPIVAYDNAWHRNLVEDGRTAILVTNHAPDAMAAGVNAMLSDTAAASRLAQEARRDAYNRFGPLTVAQTLASGFILAWSLYWKTDGAPARNLLYPNSG